MQRLLHTKSYHPIREESPTAVGHLSRILAVLCWLLLLPSILLQGASTPSPFTVSLSHESISVGEATEISVAVEGKLTRDIELPHVPGLHQTGTSTASNISIINGQISRQVTYRYTLEPEKAGTFSIPSFSVEVDGKTYATQPFTLRVQEASTAASASPDRIEENPAETAAAAEAQAPAIFIRREFSSTKPYETEPFLVTTKIYHRVELAKAEVAGEKPTTVRIIPLGEDRGQEAVNGTTYQVIRLREIWVPQKTGTLEVPPFQLQVGLIVQSKRSPRSMDDLFSGFFNQGRMVNKLVAAEAATLAVRSIPKDPRDHLGLVGSFMGSASLSAHQVKVGETATLSLQIQGKGTLDRLGKVTLSYPPGIRAYEDKPDIKEDPSPDKGLMSRAIFKFALVPSQAGTFSLGIYRLLFFDPITEKFSELQVPLGTLTVEGGPNAAVPGGRVGGDKTPAQLATPLSPAADDILDLYRGSLRETPAPWEQYAIWLSLSLPLALYLLCRLNLYMRTRGGAHNQRSRSQAWKQFQESIATTAAADPVQGAHVLYSELRTYLGVLAGCNGAALTRQELDTLFASHGIHPDLCERVQQMATRLEASAFSAQGFAPAEAIDMRTQLIALATEVNQKW